MNAINNNILPYILIILMGYLWYQSHAKQEEIIAQQEANAIQAAENLAIIQTYNVKQFDELKEAQSRKWKYGKNTNSY